MFLCHRSGNTISKEYIPILGCYAIHTKNIARKTILNTVANLLMIHSKPMVSLQLSCNQVGHTPERPSLKHVAILIMFAISYPDFSHTSNAMWQHLSLIIIMLSLSLSRMIVFYWSSRPEGGGQNKQRADQAKLKH